MTILVSIRNVYGNELIYPMCDKAAKCLALSGNKTLSHHAITIIKQLGYTIQVKTKEL